MEKQTVAIPTRLLITAIHPDIILDGYGVPLQPTTSDGLRRRLFLHSDYQYEITSDELNTTTYITWYKKETKQD